MTGTKLNKTDDKKLKITQNLNKTGKNEDDRWVESEDAQINVKDKVQKGEENDEQEEVEDEWMKTDDGGQHYSAMKNVERVHWQAEDCRIAAEKKAHKQWPFRWGQFMASWKKKKYNLDFCKPSAHEGGS